MISIAWSAGIITIPQSFLTPLGADLYELNIDNFRLALKDLEDDEEGMPWPRTHNHNTEVSLGGVTFVRQVEIIPPYRVVFEDGQYGVNCVGANSNIADVLIRNQVSVNTANSAGLITATVGGIDEQTVRDAMTAQGYTTTRAPKIDRLDANISTRAIPGEGLEAGEASMLLLIYQLLGLDPTQPLVQTATSRRVPANGSIIDQSITEAPAGTVTVQRT